MVEASGSGGVAARAASFSEAMEDEEEVKCDANTATLFSPVLLFVIHISAYSF